MSRFDRRLPVDEWLYWKAAALGLLTGTATFLVYDLAQNGWSNGSVNSELLAFTLFAAAGCVIALVTTFAWVRTRRFP